MLGIIFLLIACAPLFYYALAAFFGWRFFTKARRRALPDFSPPVSILKPLRGVDFASYENFSGYCRQDYPDYEILFAVSDETDAAVPLVRRLKAEFPDRDIRLFVCVKQPGANRKVNSLALLAREARHEFLAFSDGDIRVGPQYLREVIAPLAPVPAGPPPSAHPETGAAAVTSLFRGVAQPNLLAKIEALGASSDFFPGVLMASQTEGVNFALGASIATTKTWLQKIGGFESFAGSLADDYEVGHRISTAGGRVVICREPVATMYPAQTWRSFWAHQLRWARTVRSCRPLAYLGLLFTQGLPWAFVVLLAALAVPPTLFLIPLWIPLAYFIAYLVLRLFMSWVVGVWGVGDDVLRRNLWLVPLRDAVHFCVWLTSFAGNRINWGGTEYRIEKGSMIPVDAAPSRPK